MSALDGIKKDVISSLSKDKLKHYIFYLSKRYYEAFQENDEDAFKSNLELLNEVINEYNETYVNVLGFTFFCMFLNAKEIMNDESKNDFALVNPFIYDLYEDDNFEDDLHHDMKEIFNKERVKERYYEKRTS